VHRRAGWQGVIGQADVGGPLPADGLAQQQ